MSGTTSIFEAQLTTFFKVSRAWYATDGHQERETEGETKGRGSSRQVVRSVDVQVLGAG
jgi:hypothetical protein